MAEESLKSSIGHAQMVSRLVAAPGTSWWHLEMGESISNGIVSACNMDYKDMYAMLCCTKIKHANESHQFRTVGGSFLPYLCPLLPDCHNILIPFCGHW